MELLSARRLLNVTLEDEEHGKYGPYLRTIKDYPDGDDPNGNTYVQYYDGSNWNNLTTWNEGMWYEMKVVLTIDSDDSVKNDVWDFYIRPGPNDPNDFHIENCGSEWELVGKNLPTRDDIDEINRLQFLTTSSGFQGRGGFYIDHVRVHSPPVTVYLSGDLNKDYYIDFADIAMFAEQWANCSDPNSSDCDQYWK